MRKMEQTGSPPRRLAQQLLLLSSPAVRKWLALQPSLLQLCGVGNFYSSCPSAITMLVTYDMIQREEKCDVITAEKKYCYEITHLLSGRHVLRNGSEQTQKHKICSAAKQSRRSPDPLSGIYE
jgi:hypothetical protein